MGKRAKPEEIIANVSRMVVLNFGGFRDVA
jgi:hypothetical protein